MKKHTRKLGERGISLIEVLLAIGIFTLFVVSLGTIGINGALMSDDAVLRYRAVLFAEEGVSALRSIRADNFSNLLPGTYGVVPSAGAWTLVAQPDTQDIFTRTVTISSVAAGRTKATVRVVWNQRTGAPGIVEASTFINQLYGSRWIQTTTSDFNGGRENGVLVADTGDGTVELRANGDWATPYEFLSHDIMGLGALSAMTESGGVLYLASSAASTKPLVALDIADVSAGTLQEIASADSGATVRAMLVRGEFLYLATDGDSRELMVLRKKDLSVVRIIDLTGTADALSLAATGTALYLGRANSTNVELYQFDISDPEAGTPSVRSVHISGNVNAIVLTGAYVILGTSVISSEVMVLQASDFGVANTLNLSGTGAVLASTIIGDNLYVGRAQSGSSEVEEINIANPLALLAVGNSADLGASVTALSGGADGRLYVGLPLPASEVVAYSIPGLTTAGTYNVTLGAGASSMLVLGPYVYVGLSNNNPELSVLRGGSGQWTSPLLASTLDMPSIADGGAIAVSGTHAYHGTQNSSGDEFFVVDVSDPSVPRRIGSIEIGANVNDIAIAGPYAYLATSDNTREIVIVNVASSTAPVLAGVYNTPGTSDGVTIAASGTQLFLGTRSNTSGSGREAYLFSIAVATAPVLRSSQEVGDDVNGAAFTAGGFIVLATSNNAKELLVLGGRNPAVLPEVTAYNTSGTANGLAVATLQSAILLGTEDNGSSQDMYLFTQNPVTGTVSYAGGLNLGANNESAALGAGLAFLGNNISGAGLSIVNITNLAIPQALGTLAVGARVNAIALDAVYAYLGTTHDLREFAVAKPNPLSGAYTGEGWFTSSPFSAGVESVMWGQLEWTTLGLGTTTLQVRTSSTLAGLTQATWVGVGGSTDEIFAAPATVTSFPGADGTLWIQYRAHLQGNGITTPQLHDVSITYN